MDDEALKKKLEQPDHQVKHSINDNSVIKSELSASNMENNANQPVQDDEMTNND